MATSSYLREFDNTYDNWNSINRKNVYREELGTASLTSIKNLMDDLNEKIEKVDEIKNLLSDNLLSEIYSSYNRIIDNLITLIGFDDVKFISYKQQYEKNIISHNEEVLNWWPHILAVINDNTKNPDINKLSKTLKTLSEKSEKDAKEIEFLKTKLEIDIDTFEKRYNEQFQKAELIKQQEIFILEANNYKDNANKWTIAIVITSTFLILILFWIFKNFCFESTCFENLKKLNYNTVCEDCNKTILYLEITKALLYRLFIISFIIYIINFCVKNYNASMHNFTINSHKANSLSAALVLIDRVKTDNGNDQIMTQAANAIFSHQPTGYNDKNPENLSPNVAEKIIEKINPFKSE